MRDAEEVAREALGCAEVQPDCPAWFHPTGFHTPPMPCAKCDVLHAAEVIRARDAEVRAEALAGFEREGDGEIGPCVNTDHADAHAMPGPAWSGPDCRHEWQVTRHRLVGPWEPVKEPEP